MAEYANSTVVNGQTINSRESYLTEQQRGALNARTYQEANQYGYNLQNQNQLYQLQGNLESLGTQYRTNAIKNAQGVVDKAPTLVTAPRSTTPGSNNTPQPYLTKEVTFNNTTGGYLRNGEQSFASSMDKAVYGSGSSLGAGFVKQATQKASASQSVSSEANFENVKGEQFAVKNISGVDLFSSQNRSAIKSGIGAGLYSNAGDIISGRTNPIVSSNYGMSTSNGLVPFQVTRTTIESSPERTGVGKLAFDLEVASNKNAVLAEGARNRGDTLGEFKFTTLSAVEGYGAIGYNAAGELKNQGSSFVTGIVAGGVFRGTEILITRTLPKIIAKPLVIGGGAVLGGIYAGEKYNQFDTSLKSSDTPLLNTGGFLAQTGAEIGGFAVGSKIATGVAQNVGLARFETARTSSVNVLSKNEFSYEVKSANVNPPELAGSTRFKYNEQFKGVLSRIKYGEVKTTLLQDRNGNFIRKQSAEGINIVTKQGLGAKESTTTINFGNGKTKTFASGNIGGEAFFVMPSSRSKPYRNANQVEPGVIEQDYARTSVLQFKRNGLSGSLLTRTGAETTTTSADTVFYRIDNKVGVEKGGVFGFLNENRASGNPAVQVIGMQENRLGIASNKVVNKQFTLKGTQTGFLYDTETSGRSRNILGVRGTPQTRGIYQSTTTGQITGGERYFAITKETASIGRRGQFGLSNYQETKSVPTRINTLDIRSSERFGVPNAIINRASSTGKMFYVTSLGTKEKTRSDIININRPSTIPSTSISISTLQPTKTDNAVGILNIQKVSPTSKTTQLSSFDTRSPSIINPTTITPESPPTIPPIAPGLTIPGLYNPTTAGGSYKGTKRKFKYAPSLTASVFNIRATKESKNLTGLEVRPIVKLR